MRLIKHQGRTAFYLALGLVPILIWLRNEGIPQSDVTWARSQPDDFGCFKINIAYNQKSSKTENCLKVSSFIQKKTGLITMMVFPEYG
jgi:hypothetical protein